MRKLTAPIPQVVSLVAAALLYFLALTGCAQPRASTWTPDGASESAALAGPQSLGAWEPLGLSGGGGMFSPAVSPIDHNLMMINCDMSGAYISHDGGATWRMIHHLQLRSNTRCRPGFHPKNPNIIYAADGRTGRLKVSRDRGETWTEIGDLPVSPRGQIAFDPDNPDFMLVGTWDGVWLSRDAGEHWGQCDGPTGDVLGFAVDRTSPPDARVIFAAAPQGIWRSDDGGRTWAVKTAGLPSAEVRSFAGGSDPASDTVILYCAVPSTAEGGRFQGGIYRSLDRGEHWESAMGAGINKDTRSYDEWADGDIPQYLHVLTADANPLVVYAFNTSTAFWPPHHATVYRSDDGGLNWRATFFPDPRREPYNVAPNWFTVSTGRSEPGAPFGAAICASDPDRVLRVQGFCYITKDGGETWSSAHTLLAPGQQPAPACAWVCNGLVITTTWHYYIDPHEPNRHYIAYTDIGLARSLDRGRTWIWWEEGKWAPWRNTCYELAFDPDTPGKIWGAFSNIHDIPNDNIISGRHGSKGPGGVCRSTDFGVTWPPFGKGLPEAPATSIVLDPNSPEGNRTLYVSIFDHGVYKSTDDGKTWTKKSRGLGAPSNMRVYRVLLHQDGTLFALITAKRQGNTYLRGGAGLYRSRDGGDHWESITTSPGLLWPKDFAVQPDSSDVIFVGAADPGRDQQGGLYRTTDGGATWKRVAREGSQHFGAYFHPRKPGWVYMTLCESAPGPSLWLSTDTGDTWKPIEAFPFANTQRVEFDPADPDTIYVTTFGGSVFRGPASLP